MAHSLLCFFQYDELKFAEDLVLCTTLSYDAFTDAESMIGDAIRFQRTPRSMRLFTDPDLEQGPRST